MKELEEKKKAEEESKKEKPKSSKDKLPTSEKQLAKWIVGTEWAIIHRKSGSTQGGTKMVRRFYPDGYGRRQPKLSKWDKTLPIQDDDYTVLSENSIKYGPLGWTIHFDKEFKTFTGERADKAQICTGTFVTRFE